MDTADHGGRFPAALRRLRGLVEEQRTRPGPPRRAEQLEEALADLYAALAERPRPDEAVLANTERLELANQALLAKLLRYRELFEFAPDAYLVTDLPGVIVEANYAATRMFHCPREFLVGKPLPLYFTGPERHAAYFQMVQHLQRGAGAGEWEVGLQPTRGPAVEVVVTVAAVADSEGRAAELRWLCRDVTARRRAEEQVRAARDFAEGIVEAAQAFVLTLDGEGRVTRANAHLAEVSGLSPAEAVGLRWTELLGPGDEAAPAWQAFRAAMEGGTGFRATLPLNGRDGRRRAVEWSGRPLAGGAGPAATLLVGLDVTELQEAQRHAVQMERLAAIGQMAAGLAHESRNAIQRSSACLNMLAWKLEGQPEALDLVQRMQSAQRDLVRLYDDVREYAAPILPDRRPCDLGEIWREAWDNLASLHPGRAAALEEHTHGACLWCPCDRFRLGQVFRNVLENALAASPDPARVRVSAGDADLAGAPAVKVAVRDHGPGLSAEQQHRLFEPFYTTKVKGSGLGLAIARRIVEAHGGRIAAANAPGGGAEITITLQRS